MNASDTVRVWLSDLPEDHPRRRHRPQRIVDILEGQPSADWPHILALLEQTVILFSTLTELLDQDYSIADIAGAAALITASREDRGPKEWVLSYAHCIALAQGFPDDEPGDIITLLHDFRNCAQIDTPESINLQLRDIVSALLELMSQQGFPSVGEADIYIKDLYATLADKQRAQADHALLDRPDPHELAYALDGPGDDDPDLN